MLTHDPTGVGDDEDAYEVWTSGGDTLTAVGTPFDDTTANSPKHELREDRRRRRGRPWPDIVMTIDNRTDAIALQLHPHPLRHDPVALNARGPSLRREGGVTIAPCPRRPFAPITREDFLANAQPLKIDLGGFPMQAEPREFSTGSFGWYVNGKATQVVDGKTLSVQVGMNLIVVGSKEQKGAAAPAEPTSEG